MSGWLAMSTALSTGACAPCRELSGVCTVPVKNFSMPTRTAALSLIAGAAFAAAARPVLAQTAQPVVKIGAQAIDAAGEAFYGADAGIFAANGITPAVTLLSNGATILNAVLGGDLDV